MFNSGSLSGRLGGHLHLKLPEPRHGHLPKSPLQLVACQLRYADLRTPLSAATSANVVASLAKRGHKYRVEQVQMSTLELSVSPGGLQSTNNAAVRAYRLISDDGKWILTLSPETLSLETPKYGRWEGDFRDRWLESMRVTAEHLAPAVATRVGLRYVDVLRSTSDDPTAWRGIIKDDFLGPLRDTDFANAVSVVQQQINLQLDNELNAVLRHGLFYDQSAETEMRYLIDTDVFRDAFSTFDGDEIAALLERMHIAASSLFQFVITTEHYDALGKA